MTYTSYKKCILAYKIPKTTFQEYSLIYTDS